MAGHAFWIGARRFKLLLARVQPHEAYWLPAVPLFAASLVYLGIFMRRRWLGMGVVIRHCYACFHLPAHCNCIKGPMHKSARVHEALPFPGRGGGGGGGVRDGPPVVTRDM